MFFYSILLYVQRYINGAGFIGVPTIFLQMAVLSQIRHRGRTIEEEDDQPTHVRNYGRHLKGKLSNIGQGECLNSLQAQFLHKKVVAVIMTGCSGHLRNWTACQRNSSSRHWPCC